MKKRFAWLSAVVAAAVALAWGFAPHSGLAAQQQAWAGKVSKLELERRKASTARKGPMLPGDTHAAVIFEDRVEFFSLPPDISATWEGLTKAGQPVNPLELEPSKILWFTYRMQIRRYKASKNMLACAAVYLPKVQQSGLGDFCGIISVDGNILYQFPVKQQSPDTLLSLLAMNDNGTYAEVYLGRLVPGSDGPSVEEPREVFAWRFPNQSTHFPGPWKHGKPKNRGQAFDDLLQGFKKRMKRP